MCTLSSLSYPHSRHSCCSVCPSLYRWVVSVVWPGKSPTAALGLNLFSARNSLAIPGRKCLLSVLDWRQPVQASHLAWLCCYWYLFMSFLATLKGLARGTPMAPSLARLSASYLPGIARCSGIHTKVTLSSHSFSSACIYFQTKADSRVVFASVAKAALLLEQMCILIVTFLTKKF